MSGTPPLFEPERHEALVDTPWDESLARATITAIAQDAAHAYTIEGLWPIHPRDAEYADGRTSFKSLYFGAAGTIWALHDLDARGASPAGTACRATTMSPTTCSCLSTTGSERQLVHVSDQPFGARQARRAPARPRSRSK